MALKALLLKKELDAKRKALLEIQARDAAFAQRAADLEQAIEETETEEQRSAVAEMVEEYENDLNEHNAAKDALENDIERLEGELAEEEAAQDTTPPPADPRPPVESERKERTAMPVRDTIRDTRAAMFGRTQLERDAFFARDDVRAYLGEVRACIREKRALTNVGLTIPTVMLGMIRENIENYSKLYKHVSVRPVSGTARMLIMGTIPEAIWTDCCANLNELSLGFNDLEMDCYKVAGYFAVCNATIEDSDLNLATELLTVLGQAIGLALDKAILYGRNSAATQKMPQGIISRLAQTTQPSGYPATARTWVDLHTSNIKTIAASATGVALFSALLTNFGAAKGKYSRGKIVHVMNETTYTALMAEAMSINAAGAVVSGMGGTMPVIGGTIEVLSFVPDNVIVSGYFDCYILAERAGQQFASSEHVRFLQDQTVFKGTARYDGAPAIAEAFVVNGIKGTSVSSASVTFPSDTANEEPDPGNG